MTHVAFLHVFQIRLNYVYRKLTNICKNQHSPHKAVSMLNRFSERTLAMRQVIDSVCTNLSKQCKGSPNQILDLWQE